MFILLLNVNKKKNDAHQDTHTHTHTKHVHPNRYSTTGRRLKRGQQTESLRVAPCCSRKGTGRTENLFKLATHFFFLNLCTTSIVDVVVVVVVVVAIILRFSCGAFAALIHSDVF